MGPVSVLKTHRAAQSLQWDGEDLVDVIGGGRRWTADRNEQSGQVYHAFSFDRAVASQDGRISVLYVERGTKAVLLKDGRFIRELNRSYYHAGNFDYPLALGVLPDGREVLVHCPDEYNILEIEDIESGERLTAGQRKPKDVFHSRLSVSPDGRHLLSAGWVWHPYGIVEVFSLEQALSDSAVLDGEGVLPIAPGIGAEVVSACWLDNDRLAVATGEEFLDDENASDLGPRQLGVWSLSGKRWLHRSRAKREIGTLVPNGDTVISLFGHPRLIDLATGNLVAEWPEVSVPRREGCYGVGDIPSPVVALHPDGARLAVAQTDSIAIISLSPPHAPDSTGR